MISAPPSEDKPWSEYSAPDRQPSKPASTRSSDPIPAPSVTYAPPVTRKLVPDTTLFKDAAGNTYRVSNYDYSRLVVLKSALTPKENRIETLQEQLEALGNKISQDRTYLDDTSQYQIDAFNKEVNRYNTQNNALKPLIDQFNREVDHFNAELERVGTLIR